MCALVGTMGGDPHHEGPISHASPGPPKSLMNSSYYLALIYPMLEMRWLLLVKALIILGMPNYWWILTHDEQSYPSWWPPQTHIIS